MPQVAMAKAKPIVSKASKAKPTVSKTSKAKPTVSKASRAKPANASSSKAEVKSKRVALSIAAKAREEAEAEAEQLKRDMSDNEKNGTKEGFPSQPLNNHVLLLFLWAFEFKMSKHLVNVQMAPKVRNFFQYRKY